MCLRVLPSAGDARLQAASGTSLGLGLELADEVLHDSTQFKGAARKQFTFYL